MTVSHLYVFFGKMSVQVFCPFSGRIVPLILSCMSGLYILVINPLLGILFAKILSHSVDVHFGYLIVSFPEQKFFSLM